MQPQNQWGPRPGGVIPGSSEPSLPPRPNRSNAGCFAWAGGAYFLLLGGGVLILEEGFLSPDSSELSYRLTAIGGGTVACLFGAFLLAVPSLAHRRALRKWEAECSQLRQQQAYAERKQAWLVSQLPENTLTLADDPYSGVLELTERSSGSFFVGVTADERSWQTAPSDHSVLVLGPSQSGKTSGIVVPAVLSSKAGVVVTSSTRDVFDATYRVRSRLGRVWLVDPDGVTPEGVLSLRWSPLLPAGSWDGARRVADSMVSAACLVSQNSNSEGADRAKGFLAALLHAAALHDDADIDTVKSWIVSSDFLQPLAVLNTVNQQDNQFSVDAGLALRNLTSIAKAADNMRESVVSIAELATDFYNSRAGINHAQNPNFDTAAFVESSDTVYFVTPVQHQRAFLPVATALLHEIRHHQYRRHQAGAGVEPTMFVLDDATNTAPLPDLPDLMSTTASRGLQIVACFQDLTEARQRWGSDHGLLSKCRTKVLLPGIADADDLNALSTIMGDWDRPYRTESVSYSSSTTISRSNSYTTGTTQSEQYSTQRERLLSPSEISQIPAGHAIAVRDTKWSLIQPLAHHNTNAWIKIITEHALVDPVGQPDTLTAPESLALEPIDQLEKPWV